MKQTSASSINYDMKIFKEAFNSVVMERTKSHEGFVQSYKQQVILPTSKSLILMTVILVALFLITDVAIFNYQSVLVYESEKAYLIDLKAYYQLNYQDHISRVKTFIDIARQSIDFNFQNEIQICNSSRFNCQDSIGDSWKPIEKIYHIIKICYENLLKPLSSIEDSEIFVFNPYQAYPILKIKMTDIRNCNLSLLIPILNKYEESAYKMEIIKKYINQTYYEMKLLLCGLLPSINAKSLFCIITAGNLQKRIQGKQNPIRVVNEKQIFIFNKQIITKQDYSVQSEANITEIAILEHVDAQIRSFYNNFQLETCLNKYKEVKNLIQSKVLICNPPQFLYFLSPLVIKFYSDIEINSKYYRQELSSPLRSQNYRIKIMVLSNQTFFNSEGVRLNNLIKKQSYIIQLTIFMIALWVILMPILPLKVVSRDITLSVQLLGKMCQSVKNIKYKEDLQQQIDIFNKLGSEINNLNHMFNSTIEYFKYFIWYRKWSFAIKNSKKKGLLEQGLNLFSSTEYAPVSMFIHEKQIERQIKLAQNLKKMRKIFTQNFITYQSQDKNQGNMITNFSKNSARVVKKSLFGKEIQNSESQNFDQNFYFQNIQNRINKQLEMMQIQKKNKRYVRFSNDLHDDQKPYEHRASKFLLNIPSQSSLFKISLKSIEDDSKKKDQSDQGTNPVDSSKDERTQLREPDSQRSQKQIQYWNIFLKFDIQDESSEIQGGQDSQSDYKKLSYRKLEEKLGQTYESLFRIYEKMINLKKSYIEELKQEEQNECTSSLYSMMIERLKYIYKFIKHKYRQRQNMLKQLSKKLINLKKQRRGGKNLQTIQTEKFFDSQKCLQQTISVIEEELEQENRLVDLSFTQFLYLEEKYKIDPNLVERSKLYQAKTLKIMKSPVSYRKLSKLCQSKNIFIRVQAKVLMAEEFFCMSPHADLQILNRAKENLEQAYLTDKQIQKNLRMVEKVIKNRGIMQDEHEQVERIKNYYNYSQKKIYFIVDLTDHFQVFRPTLNEIYKQMRQVDMFQIMNLAMNQNMQDMVITSSQMKPNKLSQFESKFQNLHNQMNKIKSVVSTKAGNKRAAIQKDFNRIISKIEQEVISLSKFIVLILGGENETQSKTHEEYQTSSAQNRQVSQMVHLEILSKIEKNYFHIIIVGFNLKDYQTRQGKLKKYVRHCHDLLQIDLSKTGYKSILKDLSKFFHQ